MLRPFEVMKHLASYQRRYTFQHKYSDFAVQIDICNAILLVARIHMHTEAKEANDL